jgi:hypothetical protein
MRFTVSPLGAKFDAGMGLALVSSVGATLLSVFIAIDALAGRLTLVYPTLIVGCALIAAIGGVLMRKPFTAAAFYTGGVFLGAVTLTCVLTLAVAGVKPIVASIVAGLVSLAVTLYLKRSARRSGESV